MNHFKDVIEYQRPNFKVRTLDRYSIFGKHIAKLPDSQDPIIIRDALLEITTVSQAKDVLMNISAAFKWGMKQGLVSSNPFDGLYRELPQHNWQTNSNPNPFTAQERDRIIAAFENHNKGKRGISYSHYTHFVRFLFLTGARPSEAVGLQWKHISSDFNKITFEGALVQVGNGERVWSESSKTNRKRIFPCNQALQDLLISIKPVNCDSESLVFPSPDGISIHYRNFCRRAWKKIVDPIKLDTTPYCARDTFITEQIAKGVPTAVVAKWVDNSVSVIEKHYLGVGGLEQLKPL